MQDYNVEDAMKKVVYDHLNEMAQKHEHPEGVYHALAAMSIDRPAYTREWYLKHSGNHPALYCTKPIINILPSTNYCTQLSRTRINVQLGKNLAAGVGKFTLPGKFSLPKKPIGGLLGARDISSIIMVCTYMVENIILKQLDSSKDPFSFIGAVYGIRISIQYVHSLKNLVILITGDYWNQCDPEKNSTPHPLTSIPARPLIKVKRNPIEFSRTLDAIVDSIIDDMQFLKWLQINTEVCSSVRVI